MRLGDSANGDSRLIMICVDAMSLDFARAHLDQLPVLRGLIEGGAFADISSPAVHASDSIWPTFASGEDPGVHGVYFQFQWDPAHMRFARTHAPEVESRVGYDPFWRKLARGGVKTIVLDPGGPIDPANAPCLEIMNWSYQGTGRSRASDPAILKELNRRFGRRPIGKEVPVPKALGQSRKICSHVIEALRRKTDAAIWLAERDDWRLFILAFYEVHRAGHNLLPVDGDFGSEVDPDALLEVYKAQDRELGRLMTKAQDDRTTFVLFSMHGMAPNRAQDHFLDEMLARLNDAWRVSRGAPLRPRKSPNLIARLRARIPYGLQYSLANILGEDVQDWVVDRTITGGLVWPATPSFRLPSGGEAFIRFNVKGRERDGYFDADRRELGDYRRWLEERLLEIRIADTGAPFVKEVLDIDGVFPGPRAQFLPDLIVKFAPDEPVGAIRSPAIGEISAHLATGRGGNHTGEAFMAIAGPGAHNPAVRDARNIKDLGRLAATLLAAAPTERAGARIPA